MIISSIVLSLLVYVYIKRNQFIIDKKVIIKNILPKGWKQVILYIFIPVTFFAVGLMLNSFYERELIFVIKRLLILAVLWAAAVTDYSEMRIPNKLLVVGIICRIVVLPFEVIFASDVVLDFLKSEGFALLGVTLICVICAFIVKGGLGMGDIKLLMVMSLFLGVEGICYSMFISVVFSSITAIIFLLTKKKGKKDTIPFAPFVLLGSVISFILSGV